MFATHTEAGVLAWDLDGTGSPRTFYAPPVPVGKPAALPEGPSGGQSVALSMRTTEARSAGARNLTAWRERLVFSVGESIHIADPRTGELMPLPAQSSADVLALFASDAFIDAVHTDGTIARFDPEHRRIHEVRQRRASLSAAALMPWLGESRLLLADESGPIDCIGFEDSLVTQYTSGITGYKRLVTSEHFVVAVTPDRQRLVVWHTSDGRRVTAELHIASLTRHRVADLAFAL